MEEDLNHYRNEVRKLEFRLKKNQKGLLKLEEQVKEGTSLVVKTQTECLKMTESCIEFGGKLSGINYVLPGSNRAENERKFFEVKKMMEDLQVSALAEVLKVTLPKNPPKPPLVRVTATMPRKTFSKRRTPITKCFLDGTESEPETEDEIAPIRFHRYEDCLPRSSGTMLKNYEAYQTPLKILNASTPSK